jgi:RNA polymerase sigma-70 factor (ECF subfamily)
MNQPDEKELFGKLKNGNKKAFESLFHKYYGYLCVYASKIISDNDAAEEIVQDFFVKLWEKREHLNIETSVNNYLFKSVKNLCLNYIQHNKIKSDYAKTVALNAEHLVTENLDFPEPDLFEKIENSISSLPEKRQEIFRLSRQEGMKYHEIAKKLQISIKTVETQMGLAIKTLREMLKNSITFFTFLL